MSVKIYVAPAAYGKTAYVLDLARTAAQGLCAIPRVVVPTHLQARAFRARLARSGGAIGVRVLTFDQMYAECLSAAGESYTELSEPVQYRLIRTIVDRLHLAHYAPLVGRPGFVQVLQKLIGELKAGMIWPEDFAAAVMGLGGEPRLEELAQIYAAYQRHLQSQGWADRAGMGWLAVESLAERAAGVGRDWPLLAVDGFDDFTPLQMALLRVLAGRVAEMVVTLTCGADGRDRPLVHHRFDETRRALEQALGAVALPLPEFSVRHVPALLHLEAGLLDNAAPQIDVAGAVELVQAPDRAAEVRAALRWLKARLVTGGMRPGEVALLARDATPYRPFVLQAAAEFGLPLRLVDGLPLAGNPAVAALLDLLRLVLPRAGDDAGPALPRRAVIEAWRSPYFDWSALPEEGAAGPIGIAPGDADALDGVARQGRVVAGQSQWEEILTDLAGYSEEATGDEERDLPASVPRGSEVQALHTKFRRFVQRLTPPGGEQSYRAFVGWLEALVGPDPQQRDSCHPAPGEPTALHVVACARDAAGEVAERDVAALQALKDVLRGLVWAEEALNTAPVSFPRFFDELVGAVEATTYRIPVRPECEEILVADAVQARGLAFRAVAVLGLAEGEFPATLSEDPFLRDADRERMRTAHGLPLRPSAESAEAGFFYEAVTRPRERLLLTRPRLADNGAPWQASPFWEEVRRLLRVEPQTLISESIPTPDQAASWPELMESAAAHPACAAARRWVEEAEPERCVAMEEAARIFGLRKGAAADSPFEGELGALAGDFAARFGPGRMWSASRLEAYRACPFRFFVAHVLRLEPREEPGEGLDARQMGTIYHRILETVYQDPAVADPTDLEQLLAALPAVAGRVLDEAPRREGFRETAWWVQTRLEIVDNVRRSLAALAELPGDYIPYGHEMAFGLAGRPALVVRAGADSFCLRGYIDRVDRSPAGKVRVVDYKTGSPSAYTKAAVARGENLQLPLYALAARDALGLGEPVEGFYWHFYQVEASSLKLSSYEGGAEGAMADAVRYAWEAVRAARAGRFVPSPPHTGCPSYCPATAFCWHYEAGYGG
ncbi:MAG: PD-(D/E)XK nuclease family protein [Anaerolineae bacterium]|nr:PD-(D/E)XK nuclease family protein [Anaerolineae bacterium]